MKDELMINFTSLTIKTCFNNYYVVPEYQREYVWDRLQVEQLMADLVEAYQNDPKKEYFLGSIVTYKANQYFELIDGQQRLTTFFLILCALKRIYENNNESSNSVNNLIRSEDINSDGDAVTLYHLQLQYEEASNYLELIHQGREKPSKVTASGMRLFDAVQIIESYIEEKVPEYPDQKRLAAFLLHKTRFIQIETYDMTEALKIFETINQRGVGLNPMDLLKNMIFRQVQREKFSELNQSWKQITLALENINEKPLRFLRYFIMSNYDVSGEKDGILREDQIYDWLSKNNSQCHYEEKPFAFVQKMKQNVDRYCEYLQAKGTDSGTISLSNIALLAGRSYKLHLVLLLAAAQMDAKTFIKFKKLLESIVYYAVINKITTNNTERIFAEWCPEVRKIHTEQDLDHFIIEYVQPRISQWKVNHEQMFLRLGLKSMQQYRIKFIMAKITAYVDVQRQGKEETGPLNGYIDYSVEIEHIMPQTCTDIEAYGMAPEEFDAYINRLGNLTLLENSINKSIHNKKYEEKREDYKKSNFYLTRSISELVEQGSDTAINRTNKKLHSWDRWNKESIEERQEMLYLLSEEIWGIRSFFDSSFPVSTCRI